MKLNNAFSMPIRRTTKQGNAGFDNVRENIDPHIKTKVVNTSEINISGKHRLINNGIVWDDQQINLGEVAGSGWWGTPGVTIAEYRTGSALEFEDSTTDGYQSRFNVQLSHKYAQGEDIEFHIHIGNNSSTSGTAVFKITYQWANMEGTYGSSTSVTKTITIDGTDGKHQIEEIVATISGTGKEISSILLCTFERIADDANDTFNESVFIIGLDFHIPINTMGSDLIGTKY